MSTAYNSNAVPFGGITVVVKRPTNGANPAAGSSDIGTYIVESITPTRGAILNKRPGVDGGEGGWWIVNGDIEGPVVMQLATSATPTLDNGDFFETTELFTDAAGNGVNRRYVLQGMGLAVETTGYRKQSGSVIVDLHVA